MDTAADGKPTSLEGDTPGDREEDEEDYGDGTILEFTPHYSYICGLRQVHLLKWNPAAPAFPFVARLKV